MPPNEFQILFDQLQPRADRSMLESPLEELFIENLEKYLSPKTEIIPQFEIETIAGKFRLDFLLTVNNKKIAFECDGAEFHDEWKDEWRDSLILGTGEIDIIYRFRGKDLFTFLNDCIYLIYHFDKDLFNDRYPLIAPQLVSNDLKQQVSDRQFNYYEKSLVDYAIKGEDGDAIGRMLLVMERRNKNDRSGHWNILFDIAKMNPGKNLKQLMEL
jgi:hypothetical protein